MPSLHPSSRPARLPLHRRLAVAALATLAGVPAGAATAAAPAPTPEVAQPTVASVRPVAGSTSSGVQATSMRTRHVRAGSGMFVRVYRNTSGASAGHYVPRGGMVKGTVQGRWFRLAPGRYVRTADLTTRHTPYSSRNGRHAPGHLCHVRGSASAAHLLTACRSVRPLERLNRAYRARFGENLRWDECYRTYDTQVAYRRAFGRKAATPGTSNHGTLTRATCDLPENRRTFGFGTTRHRWLVANGARYGWVQPAWARRDGRKPEYWHFEYRL